MAQIQNSSIVQGATKGLQIDTARQPSPIISEDKVQPIFSVTANRYCQITRGASSTGTGASTIFTTATDRDFFLTGASLSFSKDATCDLASGSNVNLNVVVDGATRQILILSNLTLTAQDKQLSIALNPPVKLDRGAVVQISSTSFTVGNLVKVATIQGFELAKDTAAAPF